MICLFQFMTNQYCTREANWKKLTVFKMTKCLLETVFLKTKIIYVPSVSSIWKKTSSVHVSIQLHRC